MRVEPKEIIKTYKETQSVSKAANLLGISRMTVYRWLKRSRSIYSRLNYSTRNLKRKSTRPKRIHYVLTSEEKIEIERLRTEYGYCAKKIASSATLSVSESTVYRFLKRKGLINEKTKHRRPLNQATRHMYLKNTNDVGYLQMDVKYLTPQLTGLPWTCYEYALIDIYSRYKDAVIYNDLNQDLAIKAFLEMVNRLPFTPVFIQTDNGLEFQKRFRETVETLGLKHHYIHKSSPNENAVIERSFRTDEEEFIFRKAPFTNYDDLRQKYAEWLLWYNYERPHLGIDCKRPIDIIRERV